MEAWDWTKIRAAKIGKEGAGRTVTTGSHAFTHKHAVSTVARFAEDFKDNPGVQFNSYENSEARGMYPVTLN